MADRYLRATGNWNGPVWAATSSGVAGSASAPTTGDSAMLSSNADFVVTLTGDINVDTILMFRGKIVLNGHTLSLGQQGVYAGAIQSSDTSNSPVLDISGSRLVFNAPDSSAFRNGGQFNFGAGGSKNGTIISDNSEVIMNDPRYIGIGNNTFNDFTINLGIVSGNSRIVDINGNPTFRSLTIQSKNSAAHTVKFSDYYVRVTKLVMLGSSTANRLKIRGDSSKETEFWIQGGGSVYGQFVDISDDADGISMATNEEGGGNHWDGPSYAGVNSIATDSDWILQDPPKISTLVDEFPTISSSRWETQSVGSGYINASGGNLNMGWAGGSAYTRITTKDTYDLVNETLYVKVLSSNGGMFMSILPVAVQGETSTLLSTQLLTSGERYWRFTSTTSGDNATVTAAWFDNGTWVQTFTKTVPTVQVRSVRLEISGTRNLSSAILVVDSVGVGPFPTQPEADFSATPATGKRPVSVQFTDLTKGIPDTWSWNFGDGYTSTQQNPIHPYSKAGTYTVTLTASNSVGSDSVTKSSLIVIDPEVFAATAGGTLIFGGGISSTVMTAYREAGGTLLFGGGTRAVVIRDAEAIQDKVYLYKVYDPDGNYIEAWRDVIDEPQFTHEINTIGSSMTVELARNSDSLGVTTSPLQTEDGFNLLTEDDQTILVSTDSRNQIGSGSSVDYNNRVDITAFYGSVEPLYTEDMQEILTEDDEQILADLGAPNGRRIFTGFISEINSRYGGSETTMVQLTTYGFDLDQYSITTAYNNDVTTVPFNSVDPSDIARTAVDRFVQTSGLEQTTYTERSASSVSTTGTVVSYTFRNNTYSEVLDKVLELMPSNWYYRVGLGDNTVYFRERSATPNHYFFLGKHIKSLDLKGSILGVVNHVRFTGGGDPALYVDTKETPAPRTRRGLSVLADSRVTLSSSADIISEGKVEEGNKAQYRTTVEILSKVYDIESIEVGETIGFRNFDNYADSLVLQVVGRSYTSDSVQLQLDSKPPTINSRLEDIRRNLTVQENTNTPTTPT